MATTYDPEVIQQHADRLYRQASALTGTYAFFGLVLGGAGGLVVGGLAEADPAPLGAFGAIVGAVIGGVIGHSKGFQLRLQAQLALCQLAIEKNTRPRG